MTEAINNVPPEDEKLPDDSEALQPEYRKPTDDELGDQLLTRWNDEYAFLYGDWHKYTIGVWRRDPRMGLHFWRILIDNKQRGIKPNAGKAASVEKYCQLKAMVDDEEIDAGLEFINLQNGVFNLTTQQLEDHRRDLFMTSQLPFAHTPNATCGEWMNFLFSVLWKPNGGTDFELINLIQEAFYYSLTADTSHRTSFWLVGASGTGKSTLLNVLIALAGDSHVAIDLDSIKDNQYQLADIAGKRVVSFTEPDSRAPLADGWYKKLVSKDAISARQIHGKPFNFVPICKLWGAMNDTPRVVDRSDAVFGRVIIIPMNRVIPSDQRDGRLEDKLTAELPGIFNWVLQGGERLRKAGHFTRPKQSEDAREQYRAENDAEMLYVTERCVIEAGASISKDELNRDYRAWCTDSGFFPKHKLTFGKEMTRLGKTLGFEGDRTSGGKERIWKGIRLERVTTTISLKK